MKVSYNWLREFLDAEVAAQDLPRHLLFLGFEVADLKATGPAFSGVVVAEILEIQKHPNADRLSLCQVTTGAERLSIVCGAKNIAVGQRVPLAKVGARLPASLRDSAGSMIRTCNEIERSNIRGVESEGMLCSAKELGLAEDAAGIHLLPADTPLGADVAKLVGERDWVLEVEITPNRPDCLSHYGLARELGIYFRRPVKPWAAPPSPAGAPASPLPIAIEDAAACARYTGRCFEGVKVGFSPAWLARRLELLGLRPINNLVDITNYVMLEYGHPLHVFDADKLEGGRLVVRFASDGERLKALDGKEYALSAKDLVIADARRPVAIAGVMGGEETGVTDKTTRVLLESAQFKPGLVRWTSKRLGLRSDSSYRFERGTAPQSAALASARAAQLIGELAGTPKEHAVSDVYPNPREIPAIAVTPERVNQLLGTRHPKDKIEGVLRDVAERLSAADGGWRLVPPAQRLDLGSAADVAEEVGRHLGYDAIASEAAPVKLQRPKSLPAAGLSAEARRRLASIGFSETYSYDFLSAAELERSGLDAGSAPAMLNPLSEDWAFLRPSLVPGLARSASRNFRRGARGVRLFEVGKTYRKDGTDGAEISERAMIAGLVAGALPERPDWSLHAARRDPNRHLYEAKAALAELLQGFGARWGDAPADGLLHPKASQAASLQAGEAGRAGLLHPSVAKAWDLPPGSAAFIADLELLAGAPRAAAKLRPVSPYPSIVRDLSVTTPEATRYGEVEACLAGLPALSRLELIDRLAGPEAEAIGLAAGQVSLTLRLTFSLAERTLRDEEVNAAMKKAVADLGARCGAVLRG